MAPLRPSCSLDSTACRSVLTPDGPAQCPLTCQQVYTCITMFPLRQYPASRSANGLYPPPRKSSRLASGFPFAGASATGDTGRYATQISRPRLPPAPLGVFGARCRTLHSIQLLSAMISAASRISCPLMLAADRESSPVGPASRETRGVTVIKPPPVQRPIDSRGSWTAACSRPTQEDEKWCLANLRSRRLHLTW